MHCNECFPTEIHYLVSGVCPMCRTDFSDLIATKPHWSDDQEAALDAIDEARFEEWLSNRDRYDLSEAEEEQMADAAAKYEESQIEARYDQVREQLGWLNTLINDHERLMEKLEIHGESDPDPSATAEMYRECRALHADLAENLTLQTA